MTCSNWTSNDEGSARVGHADRYSLRHPDLRGTHLTERRVVRRKIWLRWVAPGCSTALRPIKAL